MLKVFLGKLFKAAKRWNEELPWEQQTWSFALDFNILPFSFFISTFFLSFDFAVQNNDSNKVSSLQESMFVFFPFYFFLSVFDAVIIIISKLFSPQIETDNKHQFWFVICCKFSKCRVTSNFIFDVHNVIFTTAHALHIFCIWLQNSPRQIVFNIVVYFLVTFSVFHIFALK